MQDVFQNRKSKEFEMQTVQQANWYHGGDRDQRVSVLMEKSLSFCPPLCERAQSHREALTKVVLS